VVRAALVLPIIVAVIALAACGEDEEPATTTQSSTADCERAEEPQPKNVKLKRPTATVEDEEPTALVETSCGEFEIALDTRDSPKTAASFVHMADEGVYDDTSFQRIVPGFVIQGGDPLGDGTGDAGYTIEETPPPDAEYTRGVVAMAKTGAEPPGTSGSQFFVVVSADAGLPPDYAVLGRVRSGEGTVDKIAAQGDPSSGQTGTPLQPVVIEKITIE
jgi:cyclophilin family peptidyl-prolyl cis-trans isomerase